MERLFQHGSWSMGYMPDDGARISYLQYGRINILTRQPAVFKPPEQDYGEYETRPVYGYDDCFPSVDKCTYPGSDWMIPDHGELCWLPWRVEQDGNMLTFKVQSRRLPLLFTRQMRFAGNRLIWLFSVENMGDKSLPFQHVMHPLMPLNAVTDVHLPGFNTAFDAIKKVEMSVKGPDTVRNYLLSQPAGSTNMLFLRGIVVGKMNWTFLNLLEIEATFSKELFPSIGIWWNNEGYPDEEGCQRNECALEPIPGLNSVLSDACENQLNLEVTPGNRVEWTVEWRMFL